MMYGYTYFKLIGAKDLSLSTFNGKLILQPTDYNKINQQWILVD